MPHGPSLTWDLCSPPHRDQDWETSPEPVPIRGCGNQAWGWRVVLSPTAAGSREWSQGVPRESRMLDTLGLGIANFMPLQGRLRSSKEAEAS